MVFGSVVSGRPAALPGVETMIGMFINTLPVRVRVRERRDLWFPGCNVSRSASSPGSNSSHSPAHPDPALERGAFRLASVRNALRVRELPRRRQRWLGWPADRQPAQLRDHQLPRHPDPRRGRPDLPAADVRPHPRGGGRGAAPARPFRARCSAGMAEGPERRLGELPLLSPRSATSSARVERPPRPVLSGRRPVHELFEAQAERAPGGRGRRPAAGEELTYGELDARANRLARHLRGLGVRPRRPVSGSAWSARRTWSSASSASSRREAPMCRSIPTTRRSGSPSCSRTRGASVLVTQERLRRPALPPAIRAVRRTGERCGWRLPPAPAAEAARPESLAYVIYTSGSTGRPRAWLVTHAQRRAAVRGHGRAGSRLRPSGTSGRCSTPSPSTSRSGRSGARCSTAAGWWSCRTRSSRVARAVPRAAGPRGGDGAQPDALGLSPSWRRRTRSAAASDATCGW